MSRVLFVNLTEDEVRAKCKTEKVGISAIESLASGGTRVVCMSSDGAQHMTKKFKSSLIKTDVVREAYRPRINPW